MRALERSAAQGDPAAKERLERLKTRGGLHEASSDVAGEIEALHGELRALQGGFLRDGSADVDRYVDALFAKEPDLRVLRLRGYTPGFLDGDLCEHTQSVAFDPPDDDDDEASAGPVPRERARAYAAALGEFEPVLHLRHGTNWQVTITRKGGHLERDLDPWECGY
jgi:hypothetical protein